MRYLILTLIGSAFFSCQDKLNTTTIAGNVEGVDASFLVLCRAADRYGYRDWLATVDTTELSDKGDFRFSFDITQPDFFQICDPGGYPQTHDIYLEPGDSLFVTRRLIDNRNVFTYSGARGEAYSYYPLRDSLRAKAAEFNKKDRDLFYLPTAGTLDSVLTRQLKWETGLIHSHFSGHPDWQPIANRLSDERRYEIFDEYFRYLNYHNYYVNDTFLYVIPDTSFYDFLRDADLSYCPGQYTWEYQSFIGSFVKDRLEHEYKGLADSLKWQNFLKFQFEVIKKHLQGVPRDAAMLALTNEFSQALELDNFFEVLNQIEDYLLKNHTSELYYNGFLQKAEQFKRLSPGQPAPDAALPDINGDTLRFSDFRGKVLYVDFWGTWCYPCLQELPHSLVLQEKFKEESVEFVYIGLEGGEEQVAEWRDFISGKRKFDYAPFLEQRVYPGVHMLSEGQFGNPEIKPYMINYAPTYMLIDAEGNIAQARAPRPSDDEIIGLIRGLLAE